MLVGAGTYSPAMTAEITAKGVNGQIELQGNKIKIMRKGALSFLTHGMSGEKEIRIQVITSIQVKRATMFTNGFIQFAFQGGSEAKGALFQATQDENTVMFNTSQADVFMKLKAEVERRIDELTANPPAATAAPVSAFDELEKLAGLRERGIVSEEEFEEQKRRLLNPTPSPKIGRS